MQHIIFLYLIRFLIFDGKYHFSNAKAVIGEKSKLLKENEFSSVACLFNIGQVSENVFCTATFISYAHLLTSARCLLSTGEKGLIVKAGSFDLRFGDKYYPLWWVTYDQYIKIQKIPQLHPDNDIGIIRLPEAVTNITPSPISKINHNKLFGLKLQVVGCAIPEAGTVISSMIKKKGNFKILEHDKCSTDAIRLRGQNVPVPKHFLCTMSKPYILLEKVDYGGPLLFNGELLAINIGLSPVKPNVPNSEKINLHLSIQDYKEFINFHSYI